MEFAVPIHRACLGGRLYKWAKVHDEMSVLVYQKPPYAWAECGASIFEWQKSHHVLHWFVILLRSSTVGVHEMHEIKNKTHQPKQMVALNTSLRTIGSYST